MELYKPETDKSKSAIHITHKQKTLPTMLKQKVGNCCIQRTKPTKQKKRNRIKMSTPIEVRKS